MQIMRYLVGGILFAGRRLNPAMTIAYGGKMGGRQASLRDDRRRCPGGTLRM
jgi:hypothetical protein